MNEVFLSDDCVKIEKKIFLKNGQFILFLSSPYGPGEGGVIKFIMFLLPYTCSILNLKKRNGPCNFQKS